MRKVLGRPDEDTSSFFRLMVFNSAIGNTDDHLKNFRLQRESGLWRLAPCFDLLPDTGRNREHATPFHFSADAMDRVTALEIAKKMGIRQAASIVDEVCSAAFRFSEICETNRVPANDIDSFAPSIKRRLLLLSGGAASADRTSR
jgi:serine/threonine-protein kinase HipA